jgi:hypothetical protein
VERPVALAPGCEYRGPTSDMRCSLADLISRIRCEEWNTQLELGGDGGSRDNGYVMFKLYDEIGIQAHTY